MKSSGAIFALNLMVGVLLLATVNAMGDTNSIRLAVIPFSAPQKNPALQQAAAQLPGFLMVDLSRENKFQLVEREKVNAIWSELHLSEDGFVSADTTAKLGHILSCDWLVGGSLVQVRTNIQLWIKVIDVQSSIVLDLKKFPYNPADFSATVRPVSEFLAEVDPGAQPRQFIALGKFADKSLSSSRGDWSQRLPALIERHFIDAGYGVVEREAVEPIFSEFQLETAGLTGDDTNRVKLKPAFWLVDGGYKWVYDTQEKWSVALRVQKIGSPAQIFRFTVPPGELEKTVLASIQSAMSNPPAMNAEQAALAESKAREDLAIKLSAGHNEFSRGNNSAMRNDAIGALQQVILLNPNNMQARYRLGTIWFETLDPEQIRQGKEMLEEVAASKDPQYSVMASNLLDDFATGRLVIHPSRWGWSIDHNGQPHSWRTIPKLTPSDIAARIAAINEITNIAPRANSLPKIIPPPPSGFFKDITATKFYRRELFIACSNDLYDYNLASESIVKIELPEPIPHTIVAIEADDHNLWLGSDNNGLVEISRSSGGLVRQYGEQDHFPSASVSSLQMENGRLRVGFGKHDAGYIDPATGNFTGQMSDNNMFVPGNDTTPDPLFPPAPGTNSNFMAVLVPGRCVAICKPHGTNWDCVNLYTNIAGNWAYSCAIDRTRPNLLWIGFELGKIALLDMDKLEVVGECHLVGDNFVQWIFDDGDNLVVIAMGFYSGSYNVYCLKKSAFASTNAVSSAATPSFTDSPSGTLPLVASPRVPGLVTTDNPPRSPEELRTRFEATVKSGDEAAALSLVYWQGSSGAGVPDHIQHGEYSRRAISGAIDDILAHHAGSAILRPWPPPLGMTNAVDGFRYGPNIPGVGVIWASSDHGRWASAILYGKHSDGYYFTVTIKEP